MVDTVTTTEGIIAEANAKAEAEAKAKADKAKLWASVVTAQTSMVSVTQAVMTGKATMRELVLAQGVHASALGAFTEWTLARKDLAGEELAKSQALALAAKAKLESEKGIRAKFLADVETAISKVKLPASCQVLWTVHGDEAKASFVWLTAMAVLTEATKDLAQPDTLDGFTVDYDGRKAVVTETFPAKPGHKAGTPSTRKLSSGAKGWGKGGVTVTLQQAVDDGVTATEKAELERVAATKTYSVTRTVNGIPITTADGKPVTEEVALSTAAYGSRVNAIKVKLAKAHGYSQ